MVAVVRDRDPRAADRQALRDVEDAGRHEDARVAPVEVEAQDPVVAGVGDVEERAADDEAAAGARGVAAARAEAQAARVAAAVAEGGDERAVRPETVDPVRAVGDEQRPIARDRDRADRRELPAPGARDPDLAHELARGIEDLDDVRALVGDVDHAVGADGDGLREAQDALAPVPDLTRGGVGADGRAARTVGPGRRRAGEAAEPDRADGEQARGGAPEGARRTRGAGEGHGEDRHHLGLRHAGLARVAPRPAFPVRGTARRSCRRV